MSFRAIMLPLLLASLVMWRASRIPLEGWRKWAVVICRLIAVGVLWAGLAGVSHRSRREVARRVLYLVDDSASLDANQRAWVAHRLASLEALRPPAMERTVTLFGKTADVAVPLGTTPLGDPETIQHRLDAVPIDRTATNLEAALLSGLTSVSPDQPGSAILLTDGHETTGDVSSILSHVRRLGLSVFPEAPPVVGQAKGTAWEDLVVPPTIQRGSPLPVHLVVFNASSQSTTGEVTVALRGVPIKHQTVLVRPGWQVLTLSVPTIGRGTMPLQVRLTVPQAGLDEVREAYTDVEGPPRVLFVSDVTTALPLLATALKRRDIDLNLARPSDLPRDPNALTDYDALLLFNVPPSVFSADQVEAMRTYVRERGGGLVMVGLGGDLAAEVTHPSPLDGLLPVHFEPKGVQEAQRRVCMVMLIDRSASMLGPRIAATKRAAVAFAKQLAPEDLFGVLAFDTQPYVVAEVQPASQLGGGLVERLVKLRSSGGTDVYPALVAAQNRLNVTGAALKHIILLSDGITPFHEKAYQALITSLKLEGTTISTIGVGSAFVNTDFMRWLALSTGGTFYQMRDLEELPQLVARDTQRALGHLPFTEGYFQPHQLPTSDLLTEPTEWPLLKGFLTATAKSTALVDLTIDGGQGEEPLLARWSVGRGRVAVFTSDADLRWSPAWIQWEAFDATWAKILRWAMRSQPTEEVFVWTEQHDATPRLLLEGTLDAPRASLIPAHGEASMPLSLIQDGPVRWDASLEHVPSGWYQLALTLGPEASPVLFKRWVQVGEHHVVSAERPGQPPREALLRHIAHATGGAYGMADAAFVPPTRQVTTATPVWQGWLPLLILLLLIEVALRGSTML